MLPRGSEQVRGPVLRATIFISLGCFHPTNGLSTQASRAACPVLKGSGDQAHSLQAGRACSKQSRQWGQGGTRRPCQDAASAVPGKQGLWTGPRRPSDPSRDGQTPRCPPEDALRGSAFQNNILPPACLGGGGGGRDGCHEIKHHMDVCAVCVHSASMTVSTCRSLRHLQKTSDLAFAKARI